MVLICVSLMISNIEHLFLYMPTDHLCVLFDKVSIHVLCPFLNWIVCRLYIAIAALRKNKVGGIVLPNIKLYYKAIVIQTDLYWHRNSHIGQSYRIESPERNPHLYSQLIFNRGSKYIQWAKDSLVNKCCWENWTDTCRKRNYTTFLHHTQK